MDKEEIYELGLPAKEAYMPFIKFALPHIDKEDKIIDVGGGEGAYSYELIKRGYNPVCVDINEDYIKKSKERGVESYVMDSTSLEFDDNSFDVVILFEVLEHVKDFEKLLMELKRIARKKILITVPNCTGIEQLKPGFTYDHLLATDHVNFFNKKDLEEVLSKYFENYKVEETEQLPNTIGLSNWLNYIIFGLNRLKLIKATQIYYRLYAVIEMED